MSEWRSRWMSWEPTANRTGKTPKSTCEGPFAGFEGSLCRSGAIAADRDIDAGDIEAVRLTGTVVGDLWLVRHSDAAGRVAAEGVPVFYFDEVEKLRGKALEELKAIAATKIAFPGSRFLQ